MNKETKNKKQETRKLLKTVFAHYLILMVALVLLLPVISIAQNNERKLIRDGNKLYKAKKFSDAEVEYKKSLEKNQRSVPGNYNLGNAYYKQGKYEEASQQYQSAISNAEIGDAQKANAFHNTGNALLEAKKYPESIEAYKNALKINPKDNDTRYNLAYAKSMLQQQQQQQNKDGKDKNEQKKDQQKNQQQNKEQQKQDKDQQKQAQQEKRKISKEDAEKILQALNNDEKNAQKKLQKKEGTRIRVDKEW